MSNEPQAKEFDLKKNESALLNFIRDKQQAVFSAVLSSIAIERLGYQVTQNTQFSLTDDLSKLTITEAIQEPPTEPDKTDTENPVITE